MEKDTNINEIKKIHTNNDVKTKKIRPETPSIDVVAIRNMGENSGNNILKNFSVLFKQIVLNENKNFLEGDVNMIEYLISKHSKININNVCKLIKLNLKINSEFNLLNQFGERLPILKELKLTNSVIPSIEDLGSNFKNLVVLIMDNCYLKDLSGIICFENLEEFSAKNNRIYDLFASDTIYLKISLYKNNKVEDLENITFLSGLENLHTLILKDNPIANNTQYLENLRIQIPWIQELDIDYQQKVHYENPKLDSKNSTSSSEFYLKESLKDSKNSKDFVYDLTTKENVEKYSRKLEKINVNTSIKDLKDNKSQEFYDVNKSEVFSLGGGKSYVGDSSLTTNTNSNSLMASHSTFKSNNNKNNFNTSQNTLTQSSMTSLHNSIFNMENRNSNILNINIDNNKLLALNKLNPVKLKNNGKDITNEKNEIKKVLAKHSQYVEINQEKEIMMKKLNKNTNKTNKK